MYTLTLENGAHIENMRCAHESRVHTVNKFKQAGKRKDGSVSASVSLSIVVVVLLLHHHLGAELV